MTYKVGYIVGSISAQSINRKIAEALVEVAPADLEMVEIEIKDLPMYNYDNDENLPQPAVDFKQAITEADALLFITPEYNRSIPGVLKNAIDTGSRPWGDNSFAGKPGAVIGSSIGAIGTAAAQQHLRSIFGFLDIVAMGQPEAYVQFPENGVDERTKEFLRDYMAAFEAHVKKILG